MQKKGKLSLQLFITTFIVMTIIVAVIMLLQYLFFDVLYENYKINKIKDEISQLVEKIKHDELDLMGLKSIQDEFIFTHNTYVSVVDKYGNDYADTLMSKQAWYTITAVSDDNIEIIFTINDYDLDYNLQTGYYHNSNKEEIAVGDELSIFFDVIYNNNVKVYLISNHIDSLQDEAYVLNNAKITVTEIRNATQEEIDEYIVYEYFYGQNTIEGTMIYEGFADYNVSNVINIEEVVYTKEDEMVLINALVSLENVDDAAAALLSYYPYFLALAILCSLIISFIYSKKVSKPITDLSKVSNKMANLEFDSKVEFNRNNEIGELGENLNILADNLHDALAELKNANTQLLLDIEQKKEQEKIRKEFVDNVSHELKTPLGIIRCYAESLKDKMTTKPEVEYYNDILEEVEKMTRLVMEMLELSKVESGDLKLNKTKVEIKDIIDDNIILHQLAADDKNIEITVVGHFLAVSADSEKIDSAISNIIKNSVSYGKKNSQVIIEGKVADNVCKVSFKNECIGIDQSEADKFFDRFYVGNKSRTKGSTGLGLSICAGIFKAHDFTYGISSDENTVTVWFEYNTNNDISSIDNV